MPQHPASTPDREGLGRRQRLRASALFTEAYRQGERFVGRHMVLWLRRGPGASLRLGVVSSRKVGNAVARNRARRRLREVYRRARAGLTGNVDIVIVARRGSVTAPFDQLREDWERLARRAKIRPSTKGKSAQGEP